MIRPIRYSLIIVLLLWSTLNFAQNQKPKFGMPVLSAQFAGSVGLGSIGYHRIFCKDKLMLGIVYGNTPKRFGGIHSFSIKFKYSPFRIPISKRLILEPIQPGLFIFQNLGENIKLTWPSQYNGGYYWWGKSLRQHVFLSTQVSWKLQKTYFRNIGLYFETNTNDLYLHSYFPNRKSISIYDILFFGVGLQASLR
jgi:hypothetical protein